MKQIEVILLRFVVFLAVIVQMDFLYAVCEKSRCWDILGRQVVFSPVGDIYPAYLADPLFPKSSISKMSFDKVSIRDSGRKRIANSVGGMHGLFRMTGNDRSSSGMQLDLGAAIFAQFDQENSLDNIGWDGIIHLVFSILLDRDFALRGGLIHTSSHAGDEYMAKRDYERVGYTRNERILGISYGFFDYWRIYLESGYAYEMHDPDKQEKWRWQWGGEYISPEILLDGFASLYVATDFKSFQENNWNSSICIQTGILINAQELGRTYRMGIEHYSGRSLMGEFFQGRERYFLFGFWLDI